MLDLKPMVKFGFDVAVDKHAELILNGAGVFGGDGCDWVGDFRENTVLLQDIFQLKIGFGK